MNTDISTGFIKRHSQRKIKRPRASVKHMLYNPPHDSRQESARGGSALWGSVTWPQSGTQVFTNVSSLRQCRRDWRRPWRIPPERTAAPCGLL